MPKVNIVGAGISGLGAAYFLKKAGFDVEIFEASRECGGMLGTHHLPWGLAETAANAFRNSQTLQSMSQEIGVPLLGTLPESRKRFVFRKGRARRMPLNVLEGLLSIFRFLKAFPRRRPQPRETLRQWGLRVLGPPATEILLETAMQGVYGEQSFERSASLILNPLFDRKKSRFKGSVAPLDGMASFVAGLKVWLESRQVNFHFEKRILSSELRTMCQSGERLLVATSLDHVAPLLSDVAPEISQKMLPLQSVGLSSATLFFAEASAHVVAGFGCLFPKTESFFSLGVLCNDLIFPGRCLSTISETWIFPYRPDLDQESLLALLEKDRARVTAERPKPVASHFSHWPRALPAYDLRLESFLEDSGVKDLEKQNIFLIGNYLGSIGLSQILDLAAQLPERMK